MISALWWKIFILSLKYWVKHSKTLKTIWSIYCTSEIVTFIFLWEIKSLSWSIPVNSPWCYYKFTQTNLCNMDYISSFLLIVSGHKMLTNKGKKAMLLSPFHKQKPSPERRVSSFQLWVLSYLPWKDSILLEPFRFHSHPKYRILILKLQLNIWS